MEAEADVYQQVLARHAELRRVLVIRIDAMLAGYGLCLLDDGTLGSGIAASLRTGGATARLDRQRLGGGERRRAPCDCQVDRG
jgi:hypothetical protein